MKRLYIVLLLVFTTFMSGAILYATDDVYTVDWSMDFEQVSENVYESKVDLFGIRQQDWEFSIDFFNIEKLEFGKKDFYPPMESSSIDFTIDDIYYKEVPLSSTGKNIVKFEYDGLNPNTGTGQTVNYNIYLDGDLIGSYIFFHYDDHDYQDLGLQSPVTVYKFRVTGTPKTISPNTQLIEEPTFTNGGAVWHFEELEGAEERAYIHLQLFDVSTGSWIRTNEFHRFGKQLTSAVFDNTLEKSYKTINSPNGYGNTLYIEANGSTFAYSNVSSVKIVANRSKLQLYSNDFNYKLMDIETDFRIYFKRAIDTANDIKISSWADLPKSTQSYDDIGRFEDIESVTKVSLIQSLDKHHIRIKIGSIYYLAENILLPQKVLDQDKIEAYYFSTEEANFIWFFFNEVTTVPQSIRNDNWLIWNLDTGEWKQTIHTTIHGMPFYGGNNLQNYNTVYVDMAVPYPVDDIISIDVSFDYRYHYFFPSYYGEWQEDYVVSLISGEKSELNQPWWNFILGLNWVILYNEIEKTVNPDNWLRNQIELLEVDSVYKDNFLVFLQEQGSGTYTMNKVFPQGSSVYRLFLGQFERFGSNSVEVRDVIYTNVRYQYQGVDYTEPYPSQDTPDPAPTYPNDDGKTPGFLLKLWNWILKNPTTVITIIVIGAVSIFVLPILLNFMSKMKRAYKRYRRS